MRTLTISLPSQIATRVDAEARTKGFATRSEFIRALLRRYFEAGSGFEVFLPRPLEEVKTELTKSGRYRRRFVESVAKGLAKSSAYAR